VSMMFVNSGTAEPGRIAASQITGVRVNDLFLDTFGC
jgi:hypothetical protein